MDTIDFVTLVKDTNGEYFVADHNNEKLEVIASLFLNKKLRSDFLKNFETFNEIKSENKEFHILKRNNLIIILLYNLKESLLEEDNPLEIEMYPENLKNIILDLENLENNNVNKITITKEQDTYFINSK